MPQVKTKIELRGVKGVKRLFKKLEKNAPRLANEIAKQLGTIIKRAARRHAPRRTGRLRKGITKRTIKKRNAYITLVRAWAINPRIKKPAHREYAHIVEGGAKPHKIPNAFGIKGLVVNHPGFKGRWFMRKGRRFGEKVMREVIERIAKQMGFAR